LLYELHATQEYLARFSLQQEVSPFLLFCFKNTLTNHSYGTIFGDLVLAASFIVPFQHVIIPQKSGCIDEKNIMG
jgi:hypothetical protein